MPLIEGNYDYDDDFDDADIVIPPSISYPLVFSSHLLLITATVALVYAIQYQWDLMYGIFAVVFLVYITSVWHWHNPRFSSLARKADYIAVFSAIAFGSYVATTLTTTLILVWFIGLSVVAIIFAINEYTYYTEMKKNINGNDFLGLGELCQHSDRGTPNDVRDIETGLVDNNNNVNNKLTKEEKAKIYIRATWVHLVCVHVLANSLALTIIIAGEETRQ